MIGLLWIERVRQRFTGSIAQSCSGTVAVLQEMREMHKTVTKSGCSQCNKSNLLPYFTTEKAHTQKSGVNDRFAHACSAAQKQHDKEGFVVALLLCAANLDSDENLVPAAQQRKILQLECCFLSPPNSSAYVLDNL